MTIHLDTSFLVRALVVGSPEFVLLEQWTTAGDIVRISSVAWCEFLCGPLSGNALATAARLVGLPLPFSHDDAGLAASLYNGAGRRRGSLPDCMIAAAAIRAGAKIATRNTADFQRFASSGLQIV